ncbi:hypothetical protein GGR52DRAFT_555423 [Hypoxylon sp. FL1284]|nr:hypothetical protein GGR52DRAFT_555423 [Hypoxylon sp. FL1284]
MANDKELVTSDSHIRKRLFVFCDGTWKDGVNNQRPLTNVATLARCLEGVSDDGYLQMVYYDNGVGNATSSPAKLIDGATGRGISTKIRNAYSFIAHNYNFRHDGDEIFLIGFSRGAFAVQCLASFISQTGMFQKQHLYYLRGMFALWKNQNFSRVGSSRKPVRERLESHVKMFMEEDLLHKVKIKACAIWDTVSALGLPTPWPRPLSFVGKEIPKAVEHAFQALALDETRARFEPCVWDSQECSKTYVRQCWFLGSHTDVGGNGDAYLGTVTLVWIIGQLREKTNATFNMAEVFKHMKHRFLEWDIRVNGLLGQFKDTAILSNLSSSGRYTKPSWYWWLSGVKSRGAHLHSQDLKNEFGLIHFSVRFAMNRDTSKGKILRKWTTRVQDGAVKWQLGDSTLFESTLSQHTKTPEYTMLGGWKDGELAGNPTDRTAFASHVRGLIQGQRRNDLNFFNILLHANLIFVNGILAPTTMYEP